jgi:hypothetical protein
MVALVTQMLQSISDLMVRNGFREDLIRVLRWLNNSGLLPLMEKTALRRNRPISSRKLQDAKMEHERTVLFFLTLLPQHYLLGLEMAQRPEK